MNTIFKAAAGSREIRLRGDKERGVPSGLAVDSATGRLCTANVWGHGVSYVDMGRKTAVSDIPLGTNVAGEMDSSRTIGP